MLSDFRLLFMFESIRKLKSSSLKCAEHKEDVLPGFQSFLFANTKSIHFFLLFWATGFNELKNGILSILIPVFGRVGVGELAWASWSEKKIEKSQYLIISCFQITWNSSFRNKTLLDVIFEWFWVFFVRGRVGMGESVRGRVDLIPIAPRCNTPFRHFYSDKSVNVVVAQEAAFLNLRHMTSHIKIE